MKCPMCEKGKIRIEKKDFSIYGISLGKFDTEVCQKCGEELYDERASEAIDKRAKELGLWGLEVKTKVSKSGNSLMIRIASRIAKFANLKEGEEVRLHPEGKKRIVVEL